MCFAKVHPACHNIANGIKPGKLFKVSSYFKEFVTLVSVCVAMKEVVFTTLCFIAPTTEGIVTKMVVEQIIKNF